jgi:hypothetical protein
MFPEKCWSNILGKILVQLLLKKVDPHFRKNVDPKNINNICENVGSTFGDNVGLIFGEMLVNIFYLVKNVE